MCIRDRVSSAHNMSEHISTQINLSAAWIPTSLVVLALGLVPGMPNKLFILFAALAAGLAFYSRRKELTAPKSEEIKEDEESEENENDFDVSAVKDDAKISLNIGFGLVSLVSQSEETSARQPGPVDARACYSNHRHEQGHEQLLLACSG